MMKLNVLDRDGLLFRFFRLAIVNILSKILVPFAGLVSVVFLGHLDSIDRLAGVALATILFDFLYQILGFIGISTIGMTARSMGNNNEKNVLLVGLQSLSIALILGSIVLGLQYPLREIGFYFLGGTSAVKLSAITYFNIRIWGVPAFLLNSVLMNWLLGREMSGKVLILSLIINLSNIVLDYLFILQFHWAEVGAGLSQALSQYIVLLIGLILAFQGTQWQEFRDTIPQLKDISTFKETLVFKGNVLISTIINSLPIIVFSIISSSMKTLTFTQNVLMIQVIVLTFTFVGGLRNAGVTLTGILKDCEDSNKILNLLKIVTLSSLGIGLIVASICIFFPRMVFGLLTNHNEVTDIIYRYTPWLLTTLGFGVLSHSWESYFIATLEGKFLRNLSLVSSFVGFFPIAAFCAFCTHNNHTLWLGFTIYKMTRVLILGSKFFQVLPELQTTPQSN